MAVWLDVRMAKPVTAMTKTTLRLPADVWRDAKIRALDEHRDFQDVVADALRVYLARPIKKEARR